MMDSAPNNASFLTSSAAAGRIFDLRSDQHPTILNGWNGCDLELDDCGTHFGFIRQGTATLSTKNGTFELGPRMYFAVPGNGVMVGNGDGFVASLLGYRGFFQIGGPVEETGRLRYIDGCTDSLLISPVLHGDACLNLLHIPPRTNQSSHTHPSLRIGMIVDGEGFCTTPEGDVPLTAGLIFVIPTASLHSFHTREHPLLIVAWHPDSDFGPTHERHPMLNRTLIHGRPANTIGEPA